MNSQMENPDENYIPNHCPFISNYSLFQLKLVPQPQHTHFVSDSDELILEDELQRIPLHGNIDIHNQVTGVVVAIKGTPVGNGKFKVSDVCYATPVFNPRTTLSNNENKYVNHVDGLQYFSHSTLMNKIICLLFRSQLLEK